MVEGGSSSAILAGTAAVWFVPPTARCCVVCDVILRSRSGLSALPTLRSVVPAWWWRPTCSESIRDDGSVGRRRLRVFLYSFDGVRVRRKI